MGPLFVIALQPGRSELTDLIQRLENRSIAHFDTIGSFDEAVPYENILARRRNVPENFPNDYLNLGEAFQFIPSLKEV